MPGLRELACHRITAFPGKLKGVLHSQEDGTNIFPASCITWVNFVRFIMNTHNFSKFSKDSPKFLKKFSPLWGDNAHFTKQLLKKSLSRCISISSCQLQIKLNQLSRQNTHCRTAFLQNSSLGAPETKKDANLPLAFQRQSSSLSPVSVPCFYDSCFNKFIAKKIFPVHTWLND